MMAQGKKHHDQYNDNEIATPLLNRQNGVDIEIGHGNDRDEGNVCCSANCDIDERILLGLAYGTTVLSVLNFVQSIFRLHELSVFKGALLVLSSSMYMAGGILICAIVNVGEEAMKAYYIRILTFFTIGHSANVTVFIMSVGLDISNQSFLDISILCFILLSPWACVLILWRQKEYFLS
uniref:Uncharacterized protein n=1 Tax=Leptocylindrus danicus TaxID=163516 RepID=A0A7S2PPY7_9STRA|mmetsp:Transcript_8395/g.12487  ORF Transcript_8395/g.12487 Transcript_8395/m.12487 type:complete len:179 (+) Transcript_8395:202-738(+)